ncbi:hypothetical protein GCM10009799_24130 [Nocardiopsis rhodophaea]|uniref:Uncharacterized protein n=1 Tax=Nocardiopsis rhodophaea TaxID=280238 RepID=A0ABN2T2C3_9ACTN
MTTDLAPEQQELQAEFPGWEIRTGWITGGLYCVATRRIPLTTSPEQRPGLYNHVAAIGVGALRDTLEAQTRIASRLGL